MPLPQFGHLAVHSDEKRKSMWGRLVFSLSAIVALAASLMIAASPASAASYRDLRSVKYGTCLYAVNNQTAGLVQRTCNAKPARYGNWQVVNAGYYNDHRLWILQRQGGTCLSVGGYSFGRVTERYLQSYCVTTGSRDVWEIFPTSNGRYVVKSFGAYQSWGVHVCLTFAGSSGSDRPQLGSCSLTSTAAQIYR
jgi:hypothetical protein